MKDKIIHQRVFMGTKPNGKGIVKATANLHQLSGNSHPYFSITTGNGCDHDLILKSMPHLKLLCGIHLSDENGAPIHAVANASYYMRERNDKTLANHLRIPVQEARDIIGDFFWEGEDRKRQLQITMDEWPKLWDSMVVSTLPDQVIHSRVDRLADKTRISETTTPYISDIVKQVIKSLESINDFFSFKSAQSMMNAKRRGTTDYSNFQQNPHQRRWYNTGYNAFLLGQFTDEELVRMYKLCGTHGVQTVRISGRTITVKGLRAILDNIAEVVDLVHNRLTMKAKIEPIADQYMKEIIDQCFRSYWKRQAEEAIEMLQGEDEHLEVEITDDDPAIEVDGEKFIIEDTSDYGYLPMLECGDRQYYVVCESRDAGEKAKEYWEDMAKNDKEEFACIVGESNLIDWAMGKKAGPGTTKVTSLEDWFDLHVYAPEEQWATYDSKEVKAKLNRKAYEDAGLDKTESFDIRAVDGWIEVFAYRC